MTQLITGRVWKFGDNIDTDIIAPWYNVVFGLSDAEEHQVIKEHAFEAIRPDFHQVVKKGDILVAGKNFGFGSHREQANTALPVLGFSAAIAESVARIYLRNSIAMGFPIFQVPGITQIVQEGDELEIDMQSWKVRNRTSGVEKAVEPHSELVADILAAGGILKVLKKLVSVEGRA